MPKVATRILALLLIPTLLLQTVEGVQAPMSAVPRTVELFQSQALAARMASAEFWPALKVHIPILRNFILGAALGWGTHQQRGPSQINFDRNDASVAALFLRRFRRGRFSKSVLPTPEITPAAPQVLSDRVSTDESSRPIPLWIVAQASGMTPQQVLGTSPAEKMSPEQLMRALHGNERQAAERLYQHLQGRPDRWREAAFFVAANPEPSHSTILITVTIPREELARRLAAILRPLVWERERYHDGLIPSHGMEGRRGHLKKLLRWGVGVAFDPPLMITSELGIEILEDITGDMGHYISHFTQTERDPQELSILNRALHAIVKVAFPKIPPILWESRWLNAGLEKSHHWAALRKEIHEDIQHVAKGEILGRMVNLMDLCLVRLLEQRPLLAETETYDRLFDYLDDFVCEGIDVIYGQAQIESSDVFWPTESLVTRVAAWTERAIYDTWLHDVLAEYAPDFIGEPRTPAQDSVPVAAEPAVSGLMPHVSLPTVISIHPELEQTADQYETQKIEGLFESIDPVADLDRLRELKWFLNRASHVSPDFEILRESLEFAPPGAGDNPGSYLERRFISQRGVIRFVQAHILSSSPWVPIQIPFADQHEIPPILFFSLLQVKALLKGAESAYRRRLTAIEIHSMHNLETSLDLMASAARIHEGLLTAPLDQLLASYRYAASIAIQAGFILLPGATFSEIMWESLRSMLTSSHFFGSDENLSLSDADLTAKYLALEPRLKDFAPLGQSLLDMSVPFNFKLTIPVEEQPGATYEPGAGLVRLIETAAGPAQGGGTSSRGNSIQMGLETEGSPAAPDERARHGFETSAPLSSVSHGDDSGSIGSAPSPVPSEGQYGNSLWVSYHVAGFEEELSSLSELQSLPERALTFKNGLEGYWLTRSHSKKWVEEVLNDLSRIARSAEIRRSLIPLAERVADRMDQAAGSKTVSIMSLDGGSGSGKSTLAEMIAMIWNHQHPGRHVYPIELDFALRSPELRYAIEKLVVGEPLTDEDRKALNPTKSSPEQVVASIDRTIGNTAWRLNAPVETTFAEDKPFTDQELAAIQPGRPFLDEWRFWYDNVVEALFLIPGEIYRLGPSPIGIMGYDRTAPKQFQKQYPLVQRGDAILLVGKYANREKFVRQYALRMRLRISPEKARQQFVRRVGQRSAHTGVPEGRRIAFYDLGLWPSWEAYEQGTGSNIDLIIDPERGTVEDVKKSAPTAPKSSGSAMQWSDRLEPASPEITNTVQELFAAVCRVVGAAWGLPDPWVSRVIRETPLAVYWGSGQSDADISKGVRIFLENDDITSPSLARRLILSLASEAGHRFHQILMKDNKGEAVDLPETIQEVFDALSRITALSHLDAAKGMSIAAELENSAFRGEVLKTAMARIPLEPEEWNGGDTEMSGQVLRECALYLIRYFENADRLHLRVWLTYIVRDFFTLDPTREQPEPYGAHHHFAALLANQIRRDLEFPWDQVGSVLGRWIAEAGPADYADQDAFRRSLIAIKNKPPLAETIQDKVALSRLRRFLEDPGPEGIKRGENAAPLRTLHHLEHLIDGMITKVLDGLILEGNTYRAATAEMQDRYPIVPPADPAKHPVTRTPNGFLALELLLAGMGTAALALLGSSQAWKFFDMAWGIVLAGLLLLRFIGWMRQLQRIKLKANNQLRSIVDEFLGADSHAAIINMRDISVDALDSLTDTELGAMQFAYDQLIKDLWRHPDKILLVRLDALEGILLHLKHIDEITLERLKAAGSFRTYGMMTTEAAFHVLAAYARIRKTLRRTSILLIPLLLMNGGSIHLVPHAEQAAA